MNSRRQMGYLMAATGAVLALGSLAVGSFTAQATSGDDAHHVTVCHATHSESNPYVPVTVDVHSLGSGHLGRSGTIWYSGAKAAGVVWGDIVPAVAGITRGQNVAEGHYYLEHDCEKPPSSTSTTLAPSTSTTLDSSCRDDRYAWIRTSGKSDDGADDDECAVVTTTTTPPAETTTLPAETTTTLPAETTTLPADTTTTLPVDTTTSTTLPVDTTTSTTLPVDTTTTLSGDTTTTVGAADSTTT
ncbi:MAG: hypothetical protein WCI22_07405, partial [Actinomycetota bacterium]